MASVDELAPTLPPDPDDDPYQVYTLRRPNERASSVVPQLPKQPEMAETRLRYRRIPAAARSGSFGSLGNHFPARFQFPARRSMLESLTSDDESVSFAVSQKPRPKIARKRRRRVRATKGRFPSPDSILQDFAISDDESEDDDEDDSDDEQQIDLRNSRAKGKEASESPKTSPLRIVYSSSGKPPILRQSSKKSLPKAHNVSDTLVLPAPVSTISAPCPTPASASPSPSRSADQVTSVLTSMHEKANVRASKSADTAQISRHFGKTRPIHERPKNVVPTVLDPARTSAMPVTILPPQAMSEEQRQNFVLTPEVPVMVTKGTRPDGGYKKKKAHRKKAADKGSGKKDSKRQQAATSAQRGSAKVNVEERKEKDELGGLRDKELSVSFAQPRYTAEQAAAAKPLNAMQRLLHMLAFVRIGGVRRSHRR